MSVTELAINRGGALRPNWLIDTDAQGRLAASPRLSMVAGYVRR